MKRLLSLTAAVLFVMVAWSQQEMARDSKVYVPVKNTGTKNASTRASIEPQEGQVWWNNYETSGSLYLNLAKAGHHDLAVHITYDLVGGKGSTIDGLNFYGFNNMSNVKIWISTTLPESCDQANLEVKTLDGVQSYFNNATLFDKKHEIPESGLYVGFSFDIMANAYVILFQPDSYNRDGAFFAKYENAEWAEREGCLAFNVLFGGDSFYQNAVSAFDFGSHRVLQNESLNIPVVFKNRGANTVSSIDYTITTSGVVSEEKHLEMYMSGFGSKSVEIPFDADATAAENQKTLTITKVNGVENTASDKTAMGILSTMSFMPTAIPVIEEFTGTWCGWCPRGIAALNEIEDNYGDRVISIAVHGNSGSRYDKMEISQYDFKSALFSGYPSAVINRGEEMDPTSCSYYLDDIIAASAPGEISVSAKWANSSETSIEIKTQTMFAMSSSSSSYSIGFVLVADGLKGTEYGWAQSNYYSGTSGYENDQYLYPFTLQPSSITDIEYNHVAVDGWGIQYGLEGSIPQSFSAGKDLYYAYNADISGNTLIQDKSKLHVVALLLDKNTGIIMNAAKTTIAPAGVDINDIIQCIMTGVYDENADLNNDSNVDAADIVEFINNN